MVSRAEITELVQACTYKPGWKIIRGYDGHRDYIQIAVDDTTEASLDSVARDGSRMAWKSGKRYLSQFMCRQEIVGAIFGLIKDAEMHEIHEWFRYKNASIFNPHLDPDVLAIVARKASSFNVRANAMTMTESTNG